MSLWESAAPTDIYPSDQLAASNTATKPIAPPTSLPVTASSLVLNTDAPTLAQPTVVGTLPAAASPPPVLSTGALVGIIVGGCAVIVTIIIILIVFCVRRRRKKRAQEPWQARARATSISSRSSFGFTIRPGRSSLPTISSSLRGHPVRRLSATATPVSGDADSVFGRLFVGGGSPSVRTKTSDSHATSTETGPYFTTNEEVPPLPSTSTAPLSATPPTVHVPHTTFPNMSKYHLSPEKSYAPSLSSSTSFFSIDSTTGTARSLLPDNASSVILAPMLPNFPTPPRRMDEPAKYREKLAERRAAKARIYGGAGGGAGSTTNSSQHSRWGREPREWVAEMDLPAHTPIDTDDEVDRERQRAMDRLFTALDQGPEDLQSSRTALVTRPSRRT